MVFKQALNKVINKKTIRWWSLDKYCFYYSERVHEMNIYKPTRVHSKLTKIQFNICDTIHQTALQNYNNRPSQKHKKPTRGKLLFENMMHKILIQNLTDKNSIHRQKDFIHG